MDRREAELRALVSRQHGVATARQLTELGFSPRTIRWRVADGRWASIHPGVMQPSLGPLDWRGELLAACLWAKGGIASHTSAGRLWDLPGCDGERLEITVVRCRLAPRSGVKVHFTDRMLSDHVSEIDRIPVTSIERTLMDLCAVLPEVRAAAAVDDAMRRELTSVKALDALVGQVARRGRRGCGILRRLVREREGVAAAPHSPLETKFFQLIRRSSLPMPTPQFVVRHGTRFIARLDFAYPEAKLGIECHSARWHSSQTQRASDLDRLGRLSDLGWLVEFVTNEDIYDYPVRTLNRIWDLYSARISSRSA